LSDDPLPVISLEDLAAQYIEALEAALLELSMNPLRVPWEETRPVFLKESAAAKDAPGGRLVIDLIPLGVVDNQLIALYMEHNPAESLVEIGYVVIEDDPYTARGTNVGGAELMRRFAPESLPSEERMTQMDIFRIICVRLTAIGLIPEHT
jgi:hypothetical protein